MDPFSIIAVVLGTLDASTRLASKASGIIATLKNAPADILALMNELEDLRVVLNEADLARDRLEKAAQGNPSLLSALRAELDGAKKEVEDLEEILEKTWSMKLQRRVMWLRKQGDIEKRRKRLRSCRERLRDLLVTHNVISGSRIELELSTVQSTLDLHRAETTEELKAIRRTSYAIQKELESRRKPPDIVDQLSPPPQYSAVSQATKARRHLFDNMKDHEEDTGPVAQIQVSVLEKQFESKTLQGTAHATCENAPKSVPLASEVSLDNLQYVPSISFRVAKRVSCPAGCWCQCHSSPCQLPLNFRLKMTAPALRFLSGSLFMSYASRPLMTRPCNSQTCRDRRRTRFQATYTFPSWLLRCSLEFYYERYGSGRPNMGMKVRNRSDIWSREGQGLLAASAAGRTELVLRILRENPYQMHDVTVLDGGSPLLQSVRAGHAQISTLLLAAGADPDEQDDHGTSPRMELARNALVRREDLYDGIRGLMDIWGYLQDAFFPVITKSVLGFPGSPPLEEIDERLVPDLKAAANARDDLEWQPLHWAVARGDVPAAKRLLRMGADPNSTNGIMKRTALHLAGLNNQSAEVIPYLVQYGAVPTRDINRRSPHDHAAYYGSLDSLQALVAGGVDPIFEARVHASPMYCGAYMGRADIVRYLIGSGHPTLSDLDMRDGDGETVLAAPVYGNWPEVADLLLTAGADPGFVADDGMSFLMMAAVHASLDVLKVLTRHDLSRVDMGCKTMEGSDARQLFARRLDATDELTDAFQQIINQIQEGRSVEVEDAYDSDEDDFYDAEEATSV